MVVPAFKGGGNHRLRWCGVLHRKAMILPKAKNSLKSRRRYDVVIKQLRVFYIDYRKVSPYGENVAAQQRTFRHLTYKYVKRHLPSKEGRNRGYFIVCYERNSIHRHQKKSLACASDFCHFFVTFKCLDFIFSKSER